MNNKVILCTMLLVAALAFKFWLVAQMEITDENDDSLHYMEQILLHKGPCFGPGTGDVGRIFYYLGIPFRVGIEAAFSISVFLAVTALLGSPAKSYLSIALYVFVSFDPAVEELLSHLLSDQVWLVELLSGLSFFVFFAGTVGKVRWVYVGLAALILGFSTLTRSTFIPLGALFLVWTLLAGLMLILKKMASKSGVALVIGSIICFYGISLIYYATCYANFRVNGYFGISALDSLEYKRFYMCLQSVGDSDGDRYYPVDGKRLKLIATAGPRSRWLVDQLAKDQAFRQASLEAYGRYDFALAWFDWALFETVDTDGDIPRVFRLFRDVENEISIAAQENRLKVRSIMPLPDCRVFIVLSALPHSFHHLALLTIYQPPRYAWAWNAVAPKFDSLDFTMALHRRHVVASPVRDRIGDVLCEIYMKLYPPLLICCAASMTVFGAIVLYRWKAIVRFTERFLAEQLFAFAFVVFFLWYLLFDSSGLLAVPRYLVFNNVMLPILLVYYLRRSGELISGRLEEAGGHFS